MLTLQALTCLKGNDDQNNGTIWSCNTSPWQPLKRARPKSKLDCISNSTVEECAAKQAVKQPITFESFDHWEALKMLFLSDELWLINLYLFSFCCKPSKYICIIKPHAHGAKTYGIKGKEALMGYWQERNI